MLDVVGTDASGVQGLAEPWRARLRSAHLVAAPSRLFQDLKDRLPPSKGPELLATDDLTRLLPRLRQALDAGEPSILLASGDPLWFGIGRLLLQHLPAEQLRFHPAPTSLQLAFARIGRPWQDAQWISLHGRSPDSLAARLQQRPAALAVLIDPGHDGVEVVRRLLRASGLEEAYQFWLCERLGAPEERVQRVMASDPLPAVVDPLSLVLLVAEPPATPDQASLPLFGIEDGLWLQHPDRPGLMTKREVRIQVLADLDLPYRGVLWDVGAGVGSIGLEALRLRPELELWAVERRIGAANLIAANARRLGVRPGGIVERDAISVMATLPSPDRVVLGGGGRKCRDLLGEILSRLLPGGVVVIPLATLEAVGELRGQLEADGLQVSISQHQCWRGAALAEGTRLAPLNPVLVLKGVRHGSPRS